MDFENTDNVGQGTFSKIWARLRAKSKILKTWDWGVLGLCLDTKRNAQVSLQVFTRLLRRKHYLP